MKSAKIITLVYVVKRLKMIKINYYIWKDLDIKSKHICSLLRVFGAPILKLQVTSAVVVSNAKNGSARRKIKSLMFI